MSQSSILEEPISNGINTFKKNLGRYRLARLVTNPGVLQDCKFLEDIVNGFQSRTSALDFCLFWWRFFLPDPSSYCKIHSMSLFSGPYYRLLFANTHTLASERRDLLTLDSQLICLAIRHLNSEANELAVGYLFAELKSEISAAFKPVLGLESFQLFATGESDIVFRKDAFFSELLAGSVNEAAVDCYRFGLSVLFSLKAGKSCLPAAVEASERIVDRVLHVANPSGQIALSRLKVGLGLFFDALPPNLRSELKALLRNKLDRRFFYMEFNKEIFPAWVLDIPGAPEPEPVPVPSLIEPLRVAPDGQGNVAIREIALGLEVPRKREVLSGHASLKSESSSQVFLSAHESAHNSIQGSSLPLPMNRSPQGSSYCESEYCVLVSVIVLLVVLVILFFTKGGMPAKKK